MPKKNNENINRDKCATVKCDDDDDVRMISAMIATKTMVFQAGSYPPALRNAVNPNVIIYVRLSLVHCATQDHR